MSMKREMCLLWEEDKGQRAPSCCICGSKKAESSFPLKEYSSFPAILSKSACLLLKYAINDEQIIPSFYECILCLH